MNKGGGASADLRKEFAQSATGCSGKIVFFHYPLQLSPHLLIAARDFLKFSTQNKCTVNSIGSPCWPISVQPIADQCLRGRGGKIVKILGKNTFFPEHPVVDAMMDV